MTQAVKEREDRALGGQERAQLALLALPTTALALAITIVSTYLGEVTRRFTHDTAVIGVIIGSEGVMALWIPLIAGAWSDRARTRIGGRLPFVVAGGLPAAAALILVGSLHALGTVAIAAAVFFAFYFVAYEPYRAMYPDLVPDAAAGRAQSTQAVARGAGTGLALLGGGLLLSIATVLPFLVAAIVLVVALGAFTIIAARHDLSAQGDASESVWDLVRRVGRLIASESRLRDYLIANALWEMVLAALKAFVILYVTIGLGYSLSTASLMVGGVAFVILLGAAGAGKLGDRYGRLRVLGLALIPYGIGFLALVFTTSRPIIGAAIPFIAVGGGTVMTLAYAVLVPMMPEDEHGALTGFYSLSRGIGIVLGPILAGVLVHLTAAGPFSSTQGFAAMWIVCAVGTFASLPFVWRLHRAARESGDAR